MHRSFLVAATCRLPATWGRHLFGGICLNLSGLLLGFEDLGAGLLSLELELLKSEGFCLLFLASLDLGLLDLSEA